MSFKSWLLTEMPHGKDGQGGEVDFHLEKPNWDKRLIKFINNAIDVSELLSVFYLFRFDLLIQKKYNELSYEDKKDLLDALPHYFKDDMNLSLELYTDKC